MKRINIQAMQIPVSNGKRGKDLDSQTITVFYPKEGSPASLRHFFASHLAETSKDLSKLQTLLGLMIN